MEVAPKEIKSDTVSTVSPSIYHEMMRPDAMILVFLICGKGVKTTTKKDTIIHRN